MSSKITQIWKVHYMYQKYIILFVPKTYKSPHDY